MRMRYLQFQHKSYIKVLINIKIRRETRFALLCKKINDSLYSRRRDGVDIGATIKSMKYLRGSCNNS